MPAIWTMVAPFSNIVAMVVPWFLEALKPVRKGFLRRQLRRKQGLEYPEDYVSREVLHWERALAGFKGKRVRALEIGSFEGRSAVWFLENVLTHEESTIVCIDSFLDYSREPPWPSANVLHPRRSGCGTPYPEGVESVIAVLLRRVLAADLGGVLTAQAGARSRTQA